MKLQKLNSEKVVDLYKSGKSLKQISDIYGLSNRKFAIKKILNNNDIIIDIYGRNRRCSVDEDFFNIIDTDTKAYLLGLICSDGSIDNTGYAFTFISKDIELVKLFKEKISSEHKICEIKSYDKRTEKTYTRYTIHICSKKIVMSLEKLGITNNKSFNCALPNIPDNLFWHYFRGLFDGDGSVSNEKSQKEGRLRFKLIGSDIMIAKLKEILDKYEFTNTKISKSESRNEFGSISSILYYSYKDLKRLYDNIYINSENLRLNRKYDLFSTLREYKKGVYDRRSKMRRVIQRDINDNILNIYDNIFVASNSLNISPKSIRSVLSGTRKHTHGFKFTYD